MFGVELLHTYKPDDERRHTAKVWDNTAEHLTYAEREAIGQLHDALESGGNTLTVYSMQHVGAVGNALDLAATVASAGEALCSFVLSRSLLNPHELADAKCGIAECWLNVSDVLAKLCDDTYRHSPAGLAYATEFLERAAPLFTPLFEDLERHTRKRYPHLAEAAGLDERGNTDVQS